MNGLFTKLQMALDLRLIRSLEALMRTHWWVINQLLALISNDPLDIIREAFLTPLPFLIQPLTLIIMCLCCNTHSSSSGCSRTTSSQQAFFPLSTGSQVNTANKQQSWTHLGTACPETQGAPSASLSGELLYPFHSLSRRQSRIPPSLPRSSSDFPGTYQTLLCLQCLHNTPVISMETSPGMAGCWRRSTSMWHTLSKQMDLSQPHLAEGTRGEADRPWLQRVLLLLLLLRRFFFPLQNSSLKSKRDSRQTKRWGGDKEVLRWSCYHRWVNQPPVNLYKSIMQWTLSATDWHDSI